MSSHQQKANLKKQKQRDKEIEKDANKLIWMFLWEQKYWLLLGLPFMFLGSLTDFLFPNYIGRTITAITKGEYQKVDKYLWQWLCVIIGSSIASFLRDFIFSLASEKLGMSLR